ncbi:TPA: hypothetical protein JD203_07565 [Cronobacter sakazakii]|uniref:Uncharacterized protein n=1 Tax=Cronobacter sakazakii TaxID=28141 RepID=A0A853HAN5_CROSK|nr:MULTISPECIES: hypothetical protein [Cronobacter]EGT4306678.1 hypothetical protein [Cronobacter sakazakii]EGT4327326.1 hypothetical protein [Cronobacter sakazakii]EGT4364899.1 hypothetical protein [Cronobacter sakazakii]EGT5652085.1 hypothetical protein [Cronobacter sakazakii]EGT5747599.1 hypothetical protein [Cronobacter sakazakii]
MAGLTGKTPSRVAINDELKPMNQFAQCRAMHQYYRDIFTRTIYLPEADVMPSHLVAEILHFWSTDYAAMEPAIMAAPVPPELDAEKALAIKHLLCAATLANQAFDSKKQGHQIAAVEGFGDRVTAHVVEALKRDDAVNLVVAAIQLLFRVGEIDGAVFLISNHLSRLSNSAPVLKILLLICLMEEDYNQAHVVIQALTSDSSLIEEESLVLLMIVCGIYKLGGCPDCFIDFRPLNEPLPLPDYSRYTWHIPKAATGNTTVLVSCDPNYFFDHAQALVASVYDTNGTALDVHLHIYNCDARCEARVREMQAAFPGLNFSLSSEVIAPVRGINVHYASRRFVFLRYALEQFDAPVILLDADCLVRKPWADVHTRLDDADLILTCSDGAPLWERVLGGFIYTRPTEASFRYLDIVARFIDRNLVAGNTECSLDEVALSFALDTLPAVEQMQIRREEAARLISINHTARAFSWVVTTSKSGSGAYSDYKTSLMAKYLAA